MADVGGDQLLPAPAVGAGEHRPRRRASANRVQNPDAHHSRTSARFPSDADRPLSVARPSSRFSWDTSSIAARLRSDRRSGASSAGRRTSSSMARADDSDCSCKAA